MTDYGDKTLVGSDTLANELRKASDCEACLIVVRGQQQGKRYELSAPLMSIGRDGSSDIVINDARASRRQATLQKNGNNVTLIDGGSTNGTFINDLKIPSGTSVGLNKEDMIRVGDTVLKYLPRGALEIRFIGMLETKAHTDALTQTFNKGYLHEALEAEFKRAKALNAEFSVLFIDLDHFKRVNDSFGHDAGDYVLVEVSNVLRTVSEQGSIILGRFGGEEFVILLPGCSSAQAIEIAEDIRRRVKNLILRHGNNLISMTASLGVASMDENTKNAADLLKRADSAVYQAKDKGRNRVCFSSGEDSPQ